MKKIIYLLLILNSHWNFAQTSISAIDSPNNTFEVTNPASQLYFLPNSQIANKPNGAKMNSMVGVNFIKRFVGADGATNPNSGVANITYFQQVASNIRVFQNIEQDYIPDGASNYSDPTFKVPATSSPGSCTTYPGTCVMNDWYLVHKNFKTVFSTQVHHTALECFNKPRAGDFPDKWFSLEQWGGSANSTSNQINISSQRTKNNVSQTVSIRENAKEYAKEFARAYCPNSSNCNVNYLEIGNEPWGEPGWVGYHEVFKGVVDGLVEFYGSTNPNLWPMKISTPAFRAFQKPFSAVQPTQRPALNDPNNPNNPDKFLYGRDYIGYMIPNTNNSAGIPYKNYLSAINTHEYSVKNITYDNGVTYKEQDFELILEHPESPLTSFQKIKNMSLWKNTSVFPNLRELNVTEFGWNTENYPTTGGVDGCYNTPIISLPAKANCTNLTTNINQQNQWLYKVQSETNPLLYSGSKWKSNGIGEIAQSAYLIRAYLLMARWNVNKGFIYESIDQPNVNPFHHTGIVKTVLSNPINLASGNFSIGSPKLSYFALKKMNTLLANKYFLKAIKEDDKIVVLVFGTKNVSTCTSNCIYTPTDLVYWAPQNINDGGGFVNIQTVNPISYANLSPNTIDINRYDKTDFIAKYVSNSAPLANIDLNVTNNNFSGITLGTNGSYIDWNTSDFTGGAVASENTNFIVNSSLSKNSSNQLVFTKLTAIPSVIPINIPSGCQVDANGVVSGCSTIPTCALGITPTNPTLTNALPSVTLTSSGCSGTYTWTNPSNVTSSGTTLNATAGGNYTVACSTAGCSSKSVSVVDNRTSTCPITFQSLTQNTNAVSGCGVGSNPRTYVLSFKANNSQPTPVTINTVNLPGSQFLSATTSSSPTFGSGSAVLDFPAGVRTLVWTLPSTTANTVYTCQFSFCYVDGTTTPVPTNTRASYANTACNPNPQLITLGTATNPCTNDVTLPVISGCPANITLPAPGVATWTNPTATDNCAVTSFTSNYTSGSSFPVGVTTVTYTAKDAANNTKTCSFTVTVSSGNCVNSANVNASSTGFTLVSSGAVKKFYLSNSNISAYPDPTPTPPTAYDKANTLCKNLLNSGASLATLPFNGTEYNNVKSAIVNLARTNNQYFIGCNSNTSGAVSWISGSTATVYSIPSASNGIQLVGFNPGWSPNGKGASSGYFICEAPCINGAARIVSNENTGIDENEPLFTIYPNPTNDKLTVEYSLQKDSEITFGIMDMTGKSLQNRVIDGKVGTHSFVMDVSKIIEGSYILRGMTEGKSQAKKFVIVR